MLVSASGGVRRRDDAPPGPRNDKGTSVDTDTSIAPAAGGPALAARLLGALLDRPVVVVDAGARWGVPTGWSWFGADARVLAFEPDPDEAARLADQYDPDPSVVVVPAALGRTDGTVPLHVTVDASGSSLYPPMVLHRWSGVLGGGSLDHVVDVEVVALDSWLAGSGAGPVDAIKLDAQGAELDILVGGERALADVRALVAEVHLNAMYEGAPLFGEVDAYLRSQGFELWRFPTIAHYTPEGSPAPVPDRVDQIWFDAEPVAVPAYHGQALWADALFVKRDFVVPAEADDPARLVRDAAVALGMGDPGLARTAIAAALALPSCPPPWVEPLEQAAAALLERRPMAEFTFSRHDHYARTARPLTEPLRLDMATGFRGWGWHDPTPAPGGGSLRWTGPQREAAVELPVAAPAGSRVVVEVVTAASPELLADLVVEVDGREVAVVATVGPDGVTYEGVTAEPWARGFTRVLLRTGPPVPWNELHPASGIWDEHGLAVRTIRLEPPAAPSGTGGPGSAGGEALDEAP